MVSAPRAESNCCKSECTAARAGDSGAAPRATCFLPAPKNTNVSPPEIIEKASLGIDRADTLGVQLSYITNQPLNTRLKKIN